MKGKRRCTIAWCLDIAVAKIEEMDVMWPVCTRHLNSALDGADEGVFDEPKALVFLEVSR